MVIWSKPKSRPKWISKEDYAALPEELEVRELRYKVHARGFRVSEVTLVTDAATRLTRLLNTWRLLKSNLIFLFADWSTWIHSEKAFITAQCREWGSGANASELSSKDQPLAVARLVLSSKAISDPSV